MKNVINTLMIQCNFLIYMMPSENNKKKNQTSKQNDFENKQQQNSQGPAFPNCVRGRQLTVSS